MEPTMTRQTHSRIEIFDASGKLVGVIMRPIDPQVLGPGREKVYLARRAPQHVSGGRAA